MTKLMNEHANTAIVAVGAVDFLVASVVVNGYAVKLDAVTRIREVIGMRPNSRGLT